MAVNWKRKLPLQRVSQRNSPAVTHPAIGIDEPSGPLFSCGRRSNQALRILFSYLCRVVSSFFNLKIFSCGMPRNRRTVRGNCDRTTSRNLIAGHGSSAYKPPCGLRTPRASIVYKREAINVKRETLETCRFRQNPTSVAHLFSRGKTSWCDRFQQTSSHQENSIMLTTFGVDRVTRWGACVDRNNRKVTADNEKRDCLSHNRGFNIRSRKARYPPRRDASAFHCRYPRRACKCGA